MKKLLLLAAAVVASASIGAGVAVAAVGQDRVPNPPAESGTEGVNLAEAPTTRVAVWVNGGAEAGSYSVLRGKGISAVTNPAAGIFCVRSNLSGFRPQRVVPVVSVEYSLSTANETDAQWRSSRTVCPAGTLEIYTFNQSTGIPDNDASFTVVVP